MSKLLKIIQEDLPTALLVLGAGAVSVGVGWFCVPAGIITGGCFSMAAGWRLIKGGGAA